MPAIDGQSVPASRFQTRRMSRVRALVPIETETAGLDGSFLAR